MIKRYGNRKLYDVEASRYVTLDGIRALVQAGEDVRVVDNDSGEDLTRVTFAQIIYEAEKKTERRRGLSLPLLRWLIQFGDEAVRDLRRGVERGREALDSVREAAEQRVQQLVGGAPPQGPQESSLFEELLEAPQRTLDDLQHRIDAQVRQSVERVTSHPAFRKEIQRVEQSIAPARGAHRSDRARAGAAKPAAARKRASAATDGRNPEPHPTSTARVTGAKIVTAGRCPTGRSPSPGSITSCCACATSKSLGFYRDVLGLPIEFLEEYRAGTRPFVSARVGRAAHRSGARPDLRPRGRPGARRLHAPVRARRRRARARRAAAAARSAASR